MTETIKLVKCKTALEGVRAVSDPRVITVRICCKDTRFGFRQAGKFEYSTKDYPSGRRLKAGRWYPCDELGEIAWAEGSFATIEKAILSISKDDIENYSWGLTTRVLDWNLTAEQVKANRADEAKAERTRRLKGIQGEIEKARVVLDQLAAVAATENLEDKVGETLVRELLRASREIEPTYGLRSLIAKVSMTVAVDEAGAGA